jgi:hypothetical protein
VALPDHLFVSWDGLLYDTRKPHWSAHPLRLYSRTFPSIHNSLELRTTLRAGPYAWPGGYQMYLITSDGEAMSFEAARAEYYQLAYAMRHKLNDGWRVVGCEINYEDNDMVCCHTGKKIPAAYGDDHEDSPCIEDGVDNCNDAGTGEGQYHGRI